MMAGALSWNVMWNLKEARKCANVFVRGEAKENHSLKLGRLFTQTSWQLITLSANAANRNIWSHTTSGQLAILWGRQESACHVCPCVFLNPTVGVSLTFTHEALLNRWGGKRILYCHNIKIGYLKLHWKTGKFVYFGMLLLKVSMSAAQKHVLREKSCSFKSHLCTFLQRRLEICNCYMQVCQTFDIRLNFGC